MRKFSLALALTLLMSSQGIAQMGPAGPPSGPQVFYNGLVVVYDGQTETHDTAVGRALSLMFIPSPGNSQAIDRVEYRDQNSNVLPTTMMSADPTTKYITAIAYDIGNNPIDYALFPVEATWMPPFKLKTIRDQFPPPNFSPVLSYKIYDAKDREVGPGARWRIEGKTFWMVITGDVMGLINGDPNPVYNYTGNFNEVTYPQNSTDQFGSTVNFGQLGLPAPVKNMVNQFGGMFFVYKYKLTYYQDGVTPTTAAEKTCTSVLYSDLTANPVIWILKFFKDGDLF